MTALLGLALAGLVASAHAATSRDDPGYYRKYTCQQLLEEGRAVSARATALSGAADNSHAGQGAGTHLASTEDVITVPKLTANGKSVASEIALARRQMLAIEDASIQGQCAIEFTDRVQ
jgi:hypothetical protein